VPQAREHTLGPVAVLPIGRRDRDGQQEPKGSDEEMALTPFDPLMGLKAVDSPVSVVLRTGYRYSPHWAVDDARTGLALLAFGDPDVTAEEVVPAVPGPVRPPLPKVIIDDPSWRSIVGPHPPGTPTAQQVEGPIEDRTLGVSLGTATWLRLRYQMCDEVPCLITKVGWIGLSSRHASENIRSRLVTASFLDTC